jgi:hypothetical protein
VKATISEVLGDLRLATIELATSPIAAYQTPCRVSVALPDFFGVGVGVTGAALGGISITPADENSPRRALIAATLQKYRPGGKSFRLY